MKMNKMGQKKLKKSSNKTRKKMIKFKIKKIMEIPKMTPKKRK